MSNQKDVKTLATDEPQDAESDAATGMRWTSPWPNSHVVASRTMATKSTSAAATSRSASAGSTGAPRKRAEQQRAQSTRSAILEAALAEFAEKGFEAASIRSIAERTGFQHPLITYHYPSKDLLWQAVAEDTFERIRRDWDASAAEDVDVTPLDRLRYEYRALFRHTTKFPEFHRFMRQEAATSNPRLKWVAETVLAPLINRLLPQIEAAQAEKQLPPIEPILFHYFMVSLTTALSEFGPEMLATRRISADRPEIVNAYWGFVEQTVFGVPPAVTTAKRKLS
jgi:TetR/AcrR family transcriptional regulator